MSDGHSNTIPSDTRSTSPQTPARVEIATGPSITEFLTDGSLAALCSELTNLTGVPVELWDPDGRRIEQTARPDGSRAWKLGEISAITNPFKFPLMVAGGRVGDIVIDASSLTPTDVAPKNRANIAPVVTLIAETAAELCQSEHDLRSRLKEVASLSRMSSLLVRTASPQRVLEVALDAALEALGLDAGSVMLLKEDADGVTSEREEDLVLKASRALSREWLNDPRPLSKDRVFDRLTMSGQVVTSDDLSVDDRVFIADLVASEGLRGAIHAGIVFKSRPLGVIRLYSRTPRRFSDAERRLLVAIAAQAAASLEQHRLLNFEREEQNTQRQLQLAADVQRRLLPKGVPTIKRLDMAARYIPSFELGGDFYDLMDLNGHLGVVVGDVVGKGLPAALLMSAVRASLRAHVEKTYDLDEVVSRVNIALCRDTRDNEFASLWYGVIDPETKRMTYCSAGHEPPFVVRVPAHRAPTMADVDELSVGGMVVGIDPSQRYQRALYELKQGDVLVAFTDGLTDAINFSGERFRRKRVRDAVLRILAEHPQSNAAAIVERILWELRQFSGLVPAVDDVTLLVVRVK